MVKEDFDLENLSPNEMAALHTLTKSPKSQLKKTLQAQEKLPRIWMQRKQCGLSFNLAIEDSF